MLDNTCIGYDTSYTLEADNAFGDMSVHIKQMDLTFDHVNAKIRYEPETGKFFWKVNPNRRYKAGDEAGSVKAARISKKTGKEFFYRYLSIDGVQMTAARVAWLLSYKEWPATNIAFKDDDTLNTKLENLELSKFPTEIKFHGKRKIYKMSKEAQRHYGVRRYYGLTGEQYGAMLAAQNGLCTICGNPEIAMFNGTPKAMHVDHCHDTGLIRDLLCGTCNQMLGNAKDNPATLRAAADYIERHAQRVDNVTFIKRSQREI